MDNSIGSVVYKIIRNKHKNFTTLNIEKDIVI